MRQFDVEFVSDNPEERHQVSYTGKDKTEVYIAFVRDFPKEYIITNITEV